MNTRRRPMAVTTMLYAVLILSAAYLIQGITGFGSGLVAVPLLALKFPVAQVVLLVV
jgi:uncharacterized membrane protein YfcA